ncbi:MAG TPA: pyrroline-5-carboxylate reductase [Acidimicrobiales bacterium]
MTARLVVLGGGKMGEALVRGVLRAKWARPRDVTVVEAIAERREQLTATHPGLSVGTVVPRAADGVVIAVKPADVEGACAEIVTARPRRVLSIAAGVTLARLDEWLAGLPTVRAMPNTPALIGAGAAAIAPGASAGPEDLLWAEGVLGSVGLVVRVTEKALDAVTGLSGSGPAYVFLVAEALVDAGVLAGLDRATSAALTRQTLLGAARLVDESGDLPEALRAAVTSPGGTTAAGLRILEQRAVRAAFLDAVAAAAERSAELGRA